MADSWAVDGGPWLSSEAVVWTVFKVAAEAARPSRVPGSAVAADS